MSFLPVGLISPKMGCVKGPEKVPRGRTKYQTRIGSMGSSAVKPKAFGLMSGNATSIPLPTVLRVLIMSDLVRGPITGPLKMKSSAIESGDGFVV